MLCPELENQAVCHRDARRRRPVVGRLLAVAAGALLLMAALAVPAQAYQRSMTCGPGSRFRCEVGETPQPVAWWSRCVVVHLNADGSRSLELSEIERVTRLSLELWTQVECSAMTAMFGGFTDETRIGFNPYSGDNANVVVFRDDAWRHESGVLALTSVTFDRASGEIVDADIEFNTHDFVFTSNLSPVTTRIDLQNTMVHELGHLLGLDHSLVEEATMFASAPEGEIRKRTLHADDEAGLCAAYPVDAAPARVCNRHTIGFYEAPRLAMNEAPEAACSAVALRSASGGRWAVLVAVWLLGAAGLVAARRSRR